MREIGLKTLQIANARLERRDESRRQSTTAATAPQRVLAGLGDSSMMARLLLLIARSL